MGAQLEIRIDDLTGEAVRALVARHLAGMAEDTPAEHGFALGVEKLQAPDITFWSAWVADEVVGCGALRHLDDARGEIKSMRVADAWVWSCWARRYGSALTLGLATR